MGHYSQTCLQGTLRWEDNIYPRSISVFPNVLISQEDYWDGVDFLCNLLRVTELILSHGIISGNGVDYDASAWWWYYILQVTELITTRQHDGDIIYVYLLQVTELITTRQHDGDIIYYR